MSDGGNPPSKLPLKEAVQYPREEGTINMRCPRCSLFAFGITREEFDPPHAVLIETLCPDCMDELQAREPESSYYNAQGQLLNWLEMK